MQFVGWMYDIGREQSPREDALRVMLERSLMAGYNAVGFYLEHRYAYPSAPWAADEGCLTPELVRKLSAEFRPRGLRVIPFLNVLGHMEGFIRSEGGQWLGEGPSTGSAQMCPSRQECIDFGRKLITDALDAFEDEWMHLGGDETNQLGQCEICADRATKIGKAGIYASYFAPLCEWVVSLGKRPCLWGDMLIEHPDVLVRLPKETIMFDWHYGERPYDSTKMFRDAGFDVVCCPAVRSYDSFFCHLNETRENIDQHAEDAEKLRVLGVLVTTWEFSYFTNYASTLPIIYSAGRRLALGENWHTALAAEGGEAYAEMATAMGIEAEDESPFLAWPGWRRLRQSFVLSQNPFFLWKEWRDEVCGEVGDKLLAICARFAGEYPADFLRISIDWVRGAERAYKAYALRETEEACARLRRLAPLFDDLHRWMAHFAALGGSQADVGRVALLRRRLHDAIVAIDKLDNGYLPAFETITHPAYVPGDQAAWRTGQY
ncbi:MAG: family 20 glycosylhydrolase [Fimbriimonadales bacterium]